MAGHDEPDWLKESDPFFHDLYRWCGQSQVLFFIAVPAIGIVMLMLSFLFMAVVISVLTAHGVEMHVMGR